MKRKAISHRQLELRQAHEDLGLHLDRPLDDDSIEISAKLGFLIDMAERGPEERQEECLQAARRIASTVLRVGLAPDGGVAAKYRPSDGRPDPHVTHLRRLDLPAQLVRLSAFEQPEDAILQVDLPRTDPGSTTRGRAVADLVPAAAPLLPPGEVSTASGTRLAGELGHGPNFGSAPDRDAVARSRRRDLARPGSTRRRDQPVAWCCSRCASPSSQPPRSAA